MSNKQTNEGSSDACAVLGTMSAPQRAPQRAGVIGAIAISPGMSSGFPQLVDALNVLPLYLANLEV